MKKLTQQEVAEQLKSITARFLQESGIEHRREIKTDDSLQRHLGIDSLGRAELFRRFEKQYKVTFPDRLLAEVETLDDIIHYLDSVHPTYKAPSRKEVMSKHGDESTVDPSQAQSLVDLLLLYGEKTPNKVHIYFQNENGGEETLTYGELLDRSRKVAHALREHGLKEGETVAIMQPTHFGFFYTFFGTLFAGGIPVPIYPPFRPHMIEAYAKTEARILNSAQVRILVTFDRAENLSRLLQGFVPSLKVVTTVHDLMKESPLENIHSAKADQFAFIQYTSGSTSDPKGVLLTHYNLLSNIRAYGKAIKAVPTDVVVSWLPLYHDFGLIGAWLGSLYHGVPLILMTPFSFLNHPERWLWAIHYHRATISGAPNFAYELCVHKIEPEKLEGLDLSSWRIAANGAEKVYARTLEAFQAKFEPYGLSQTTLMPVYGLAESTVGLAIPPLGRKFKIDEVDRKEFEENRNALPATGKNTLSFVGCGMAIEGHQMRVVDDDGGVLPDRQVGNLQFTGPSSMQGYFNNPQATRAIYHDGWIDSGDLAYMVDGEVFITGRRKDLNIKAGRNLYPAEVEELAGNVPGIRIGCVAAFEVTDDKRGTEQLIVVAETREKSKQKLEDIRQNVNDAIASVLDIAPDRVILVAPHTVPKTSSGKLQRAACKALYQQGRLNKWQMPAWLQVTKLALEWFGWKFKEGIQLGAKVVYTSYVAALTMVFVMPLYLLAFTLKQASFRKTCRRFARLFMTLIFCPIKVVGKENLTREQPVIYASNHASYIDAIVMIATAPIQTSFVGKQELMKAPFIRTFMKKLGYLSVDRLDFSKGTADTHKMKEALHHGESIVIFPEGTFSYAAGLRPFRLGAFKTAAEAHVSVCPIALAGTRQILRDDEMLMRPNRVTMTVCEPLQVEGDQWEAVTRLRDLTRAEIAKYCGEPSLDFIVAQPVAPKHHRQ